MEFLPFHSSVMQIRFSLGLTQWHDSLHTRSRRFRRRFRLRLSQLRRRFRYGIVALAVVIYA